MGESMIGKLIFLGRKMNQRLGKSFPGGSREKVNKAGASVRNGTASPDDLVIIETWRAAHRNVLNTFQAILRNRTKNLNVIVAQRHKRRNTIFDKLNRLPRLMLGRLDDVAGCRLIFQTLEELNEFRSKFHKARFKHHRRNDVDKYNYILNPKKSGYRGIHDVYEYNVNSKNGDLYSGLNVEIQYRTLVQHAWATAVEVIGFITLSQPKYEQGDNRYVRAMVLASEILARAHEECNGPLPNLSPQDLLAEFASLDKDLGLLRNLKGLNSANNEVIKGKNTILIFGDSGELQVKTYRDATDALAALFSLEKENPKLDIVLVRADSADDVREAFRNYFSDAQDFIELIEDGCAKLSSKKVRRKK